MIINLLTFYLFDDIGKNIGITHVNHSATPRAILTKVHDCTCNLNVYVFYLRIAIGIIHSNRYDRKHQKQLFYSSEPPFFQSLKSVTLLLFEEILVLTLY